MTEEKVLSSHEYMMDTMCKNCERFKIDLDKMKRQEAVLKVDMENITDLLTTTRVKISKLEKQGIKRPDPKLVKKAIDEEAQKRAGGIPNG